MALKTVIDKLDDVEEIFREHYVETVDPKTKAVQFVLGLEGSIDPLPQVKSLRTENGAYRIKQREMEAKYGKFDAFKDMDPAEILAKLDRIAELEAAAGGKLDEKQIEAIVEGRLKTKLSPLERERDKLAKENAEKDAKLAEYDSRDRTRSIKESVTAAAIGLKMLPEAIDDAVMLAERVMEVNAEGGITVKDNVGFTPGLDAKLWLTDMQVKRPHWWGPSGGGGSRGNGGLLNLQGGNNPWANATWNVTEQNKIYTQDKKQAERLAASAGTKIGGTKPPASKK